MLGSCTRMHQKLSLGWESLPPSLLASLPTPYNAGFWWNERFLPYALPARCQQSGNSELCYLQQVNPSAFNRNRNSPRGFIALAQGTTASDSLAILLDGHADALGNPVTRQADLSRHRNAKDKCLSIISRRITCGHGQHCTW